LLLKVRCMISIVQLREKLICFSQFVSYNCNKIEQDTLWCNSVKCILFAGKLQDIASGE